MLFDDGNTSILFQNPHGPRGGGGFSFFWWIFTPYLLCRNRSAAAQRCACYLIELIIALKSISNQGGQFHAVRETYNRLYTAIIYWLNDIALWPISSYCCPEATLFTFKWKSKRQFSRYFLAQQGAVVLKAPLWYVALG